MYKKKYASDDSSSEEEGEPVEKDDYGGDGVPLSPG